MAGRTVSQSGGGTSTVQLQFVNAFPTSAEERSRQRYTINARATSYQWKQAPKIRSKPERRLDRKQSPTLSEENEKVPSSKHLMNNQLVHTPSWMEHSMGAGFVDPFDTFDSTVGLHRTAIGRLTHVHLGHTYHLFAATMNDGSEAASYAPIWHDGVFARPEFFHTILLAGAAVRGGRNICSEPEFRGIQNQVTLSVHRKISVLHEQKTKELDRDLIFLMIVHTWKTSQSSHDVELDPDAPRQGPLQALQTLDFLSRVDPEPKATAALLSVINDIGDIRKIHSKIRPLYFRTEVVYRLPRNRGRT